MTASNIHSEIAERTPAIAHGDIKAIHLLARKIGLIHEIDEGLHLLKRPLSYLKLRTHSPRSNGLPPARWSPHSEPVGTAGPGPWCQWRQGGSPGDRPCETFPKSGSPPRLEDAGHRVATNQLWHHLPATDRRVVLRPLARDITQRLPAPPTPKEAGHEPR